MSVKSAILTLAFFVAALAPAPRLWAAAASDDDWQVWGKRQDTGEDVPMSEPLSQAAAKTRLKQLAHDSYVKGGALYDDPSKPIKGTLRVLHLKSDVSRDQEPPRNDKDDAGPAGPKPGGKPRIEMPEKPNVDPKTTSDPDKEKPSLGGKTFVGSESAADTTSLKFVFNEDGGVVAYDDIGVWTGTWKMIGKTNVVILLTEPSPVNYSGQIDGDQIGGKAGRPGQRGQWKWKVQLSP